MVEATLLGTPRCSGGGREDLGTCKQRKCACPEDIMIKCCWRAIEEGEKINPTSHLVLFIHLLTFATLQRNLCPHAARRSLRTQHGRAPLWWQPGCGWPDCVLWGWRAGHTAAKKPGPCCSGHDGKAHRGCAGQCLQSCFQPFTCHPQ